MTNEHREILQRINAYSEQVLGQIDPQKVQVSVQLDNVHSLYGLADRSILLISEITKKFSS